MTFLVLSAFDAACVVYIRFTHFILRVPIRSITSLQGIVEILGKKETVHLLKDTKTGKFQAI